MSASRPSQDGAALATALLFLIVLTLLGIGAMREARLSLRMAANEANRVDALETSQSLVDALLADVDTHFPVTPQADEQLSCFPGGLTTGTAPLHAPFSCGTANLTLPETPNNVLETRTYVEIWREAVNGEALVSAASIGSTETTARVRYARFRITAGIDRSGTGEGVAEVVEGVQIAVPAVDSVNLF